MQQDEHNDDDSRDKELMLQMQQTKSESALRELIVRHQNAIYAFAYRMLNNEADARDITQRTFIRVWNAAQSYKPDCLFSTWLFTIAKHLIFNESRRRKRKPHISINEAEDAGFAQHADTAAPTPHEALAQKELAHEINKAMQALPEKARMAIQLRRFHDMSYEDIAGIIGTSIASTKSIIFRARQQLKEALKHYLN